VDPLGGASVAYYDALAERYHLNMEVVNHSLDPTFRFMTVDWDGQIRMDPSSIYAMARLIDLKERFAVAFASDTDAGSPRDCQPQPGIATPNNYLAVAIAYLFTNRPGWPKRCGGQDHGEQQSDRSGGSPMNRRLVEVPWGLNGSWTDSSTVSLGFGGEESAGATFLRRTALSGPQIKTGWFQTCWRRRSPPAPARTRRAFPGTDRGVRHLVLYPD